MHLLFTIFLSFFTLFTPFATSATSDKVDEFNAKIKEGYESYYVHESINNETYSIKIIIGICNDSLTYSFVFANEEAQESKVYVLRNQQYYSPEEDERGDVAAYALPLTNHTSIEIVTGNTIRFASNITYYETKEEFLSAELTSQKIVGENKGIEVTNLSSSQSTFLDPITILIIIFAVIIFGCVLTLFIMLVMKKGLFNPKNRRGNIPQFQPYVTPRVTPYQEAEVVEEKEEPINKKPIYDRQGNYEEDIETIGDIEVLLKEQGFSRNYSTMSEDEKNQVMLALMHLRRTNQISESQYQQEIIQLWS